MNLDKYITPAQAARIRGVSRARITAMVNAGILRQIPVDGGYLLLKAEVENYQPRKPGRPSKTAKKSKAHI